jgi:hypothetical protein
MTPAEEVFDRIEYTDFERLDCAARKKWNAMRPWVVA